MSSPVGKEVHLVLKNDLREIETLARTMRELGNANDLSDEARGDARLALEEIFSNVVLHGYDDRQDHEIEVSIHLNAERLCFEVRDDGKPFDPLQAPKPNLDRPFGERKIGGMGLLLVSQVMDEMEYRREPNRNILTMRRGLKGGS